MSNFTDNPIEWFEQFQVRFSKNFRTWAVKAAVELPAQIAALDRKIEQASGPDAVKLRREKREREKLLRLAATAPKFTEDAYAKCTQRERNLHEKAFCTNAGDPAYRELTTLRYRDGATERRMNVPRGDVLHQFREDVRDGRLPAVSWIVPPENFSDHPGAPWYGAWMVSEVRHPDEESGSLEEDHLHPDVRRERRLFRSCALICSAGPEAARNRARFEGNRYQPGIYLRRR